MRRSYGRDIWLSARMAVALVIVGLIYLVAEAIALAVMLAGVVDRDVWTTITGLALMLGIVGALVVQMRKPEAMLLRTVRAKGA